MDIYSLDFYLVVFQYVFICIFYWGVVFFVVNRLFDYLLIRNIKRFSYSNSKNQCGKGNA